MIDLSFYKGKRILLTGHTGFKGAWLCEILLSVGAEVTGYSLDPPTTPGLFQLLLLESRMNSVAGDIRDLNKLEKTFRSVNPEIVIHMAAQPIVRESYKNPAHTYEVNVMGTVNVLECIRRSNSVRSFVNVTTDKVYKNREWEWGYRENEELNGYDPYSNSKSCSELVTDSYKNSFFSDRDIAISTMRSGNVIGGGDFATDRIIPDCIRAILAGEKIMVRNPLSVRPYQHVLEPLNAYLLVAQRQYDNKGLQGSYNVGPDEKDCVTTGHVVNMFCKNWGSGAQWIKQGNEGPHEANLLKLDCSKMKAIFKWNPTWCFEEAIKYTVSWYQAFAENQNILWYTQKQIESFYKCQEVGL